MKPDFPKDFELLRASLQRFKSDEDAGVVIEDVNFRLKDIKALLGFEKSPKN